MSAIQCTHVGSLPRSQEVSEVLFARENEHKYEEASFGEFMAGAVESCVGKQVQAGIDIVSDGECSKISYATYLKDRYRGFSGDSPRNTPKDLQLFPGFSKKIAASGGAPTYARPMCTAELSAPNYHELDRDIANLKAAMDKHGVQRGFMNAASPGVVALFMPNDHYQSRSHYLQALAEILSVEYQRICAAGLDVQIDCPDLALARHMLFNELSDDEFVRVIAEQVEALNHALARVPVEQIRVHICWGNYEGPHVCDIGMDKVFSTLLSVKARYLLFENANPRHAHEWRVFQERKSEIPEDKVLIPGVIDSTSNFVEHPELVAERLRRFVAMVGKERVIAGSDCGFGTFAGFGAVDADIAYAKLASLRAGADLAST